MSNSTGWVVIRKRVTSSIFSAMYASIIASLKTRIAGFKVPKRVHVVDELPRNAMGKVQKAELRKRYAQG